MIRDATWLLARLAFDASLADVIARGCHGAPALLQALFSSDKAALDNALRCFVSVLQVPACLWLPSSDYDVSTLGEANGACCGAACCFFTRRALTSQRR